jgi:hypothetical protein
LRTAVKKVWDKRDELMSNRCWPTDERVNKKLMEGLMDKKWFAAVKGEAKAPVRAPKRDWSPTPAPSRAGSPVPNPEDLVLINLNPARQNPTFNALNPTPEPSPTLPTQRLNNASSIKPARVNGITHITRGLGPRHKVYNVEDYGRPAGTKRKASDNVEDDGRLTKAAKMDEKKPMNGGSNSD